MVLLVYKAGALENGDKVVKVTMDIGDDDFGFRRLRWRLRSSGRGDANPANTKARRMEIQARWGEALTGGRTIFLPLYNQAVPKLSENIEFSTIAALDTSPQPMAVRLIYKNSRISSALKTSDRSLRS